MATYYGYTKVGNHYIFKYEYEMLEAANKLEKEGYSIKRGHDPTGSFYIDVIGYR